MTSQTLREPIKHRWHVEYSKEIKNVVIRIRGINYRVAAHSQLKNNELVNCNILLQKLFENCIILPLKLFQSFLTNFISYNLLYKM